MNKIPEHQDDDEDDTAGKTGGSGSAGADGGVGGCGTSTHELMVGLWILVGVVGKEWQICLVVGERIRGLFHQSAWDEAQAEMGELYRRTLHGAGLLDYETGQPCWLVAHLAGDFAVHVEDDSDYEPCSEAHYRGDEDSDVNDVVDEAQELFPPAPAPDSPSAQNDWTLQEVLARFDENRLTVVDDTVVEDTAFEKVSLDR